MSSDQVQSTQDMDQQRTQQYEATIKDLRQLTKELHGIKNRIQKRLRRTGAEPNLPSRIPRLIRTNLHAAIQQQTE